MLDKNGDLELRAIEVERLFDYSTNLVNHKEIKSSIQTYPEDVLFIIVDSKSKVLSRQPWNGKDSDVPKRVKATIDIESGFFKLKVSDFDNYRQPFAFPKNANKPEGVQINAIYETRVVHEPTMINCAHFELHIYSNHESIDADDFKRIKSGNIKPPTYRHFIIHSIRSRIIHDRLYHV